MQFGVCFDRISGSDDFDLIEYVEEHEIDSKQEFDEVISENVTGYEISDDYSDIVFFDITVDHEESLVYVDVVRDLGTDLRGSKSGSVSREYYSQVGVHIFTISVTGNFTYSSGSCSCTSASGSFTPALLSLWTSSPVISRGNLSSGKAFARINGTATLITQNLDYSLRLTCDSNGVLRTE